MMPSGIPTTKPTTCPKNLSPRYQFSAFDNDAAFQAWGISFGYMYLDLVSMETYAASEHFLSPKMKLCDDSDEKHAALHCLG